MMIGKNSLTSLYVYLSYPCIFNNVIIQQGVEHNELMDIHSECVQDVSRKILNGVNCKETYKMNPFSKGEAGVTVTVTQGMSRTYDSFFNHRQKQGL